MLSDILLSCFFFNDTATTEIYTLSLHDALPISASTFSPMLIGAHVSPAGGLVKAHARGVERGCDAIQIFNQNPRMWRPDRKSTRLNSSHANISYAVFCLKKKNKQNINAV